MSSKDFSIKIITPTEEIFGGGISSLVAPGTDGYFGIKRMHAALVASLQIGEIRVQTEAGETRSFATSGGFLEVSDNTIIVLAESAEDTTNIDHARAEAAKERAANRIKEGRKAWDVKRAEVALARAINRIKLSN